MWDQVQDMLRRAGLRTAENVAEFLPGLLGLIVILLATVVVALLARNLLLRLLTSLRFDQRAEQWGLGTLADWSVAGGPSLVLARVVMWIILIAGVLASFSALDAALPEEFARTVFGYIPNLLAALLILMVGSVLARFLARSVLIGTVNLQVPAARLLALGVKWLVLILAWAMALEHLGIGRKILPLAFGILFGGIVLALSLALGLGSKDVVRGLLERQVREPAESPDKLPHV
jgi:Conserved TM helix